jgi:hypothetical protein
LDNAIDANKTKKKPMFIHSDINNGRKLKLVFGNKIKTTAKTIKIKQTNNLYFCVSQKYFQVIF